MTAFWMVRAGDAGRLVSDFERLRLVAVGWSAVGDLTTFTAVEQFRTAVARAYPDAKPGNVIISGSTLMKFRGIIATGDRVVTYDPSSREYMLGTVQGPYAFRPDLVPDYPHIRPIKWDGRVDRDRLSASSKNTLGSIVTLFQPSDEALIELESLLRGTSEPTEPHVAEDEESTELVEVRLDAVARAREFLKDRLLRLSPDDMELLVASLLRAMGYRARVTPKSADGGRDVFASPDGLGFRTPRIVAEVKHRPRDRMGPEQVRSFLGGLRSGDCGLYVSTGGFTREARYEADRATIPLTMVGLDDFADLVVEHYETLDAEGRTLVPLVKIYWPVA
jgi:restriction system protein